MSLRCRLGAAWVAGTAEAAERFEKLQRAADLLACLVAGRIPEGLFRGDYGCEFKWPARGAADWLYPIVPCPAHRHLLAADLLQ
jgi:hypothetical protein